MELKLDLKHALALLNFLQAEEDLEGDLPKELRELKEALRERLKEQGVRRSAAGSYYLARGA